MNTRHRKLLLGHLPLVAVLLIAAYLELLDTSTFEQFRSEDTFGWVLTLWMPLGVLLGIVQLFIWGRWLFAKSSLVVRKRIRFGFLIILLAFFCVLAIRTLS